MRLDKFSNPVFNEQDIFDALYQGHTDILMQATVDTTDEIKKLAAITHTHLLEPIAEDEITIEQFDQWMQSNWFMPDEYKTMDIEQWIWDQTPPWDPNHTRVEEELAAYKARNMLDLLRWLKYFVDTCSKEDIVCGVGRGSSVASYVLFLMGVHSIDSIKYNLDWQEFLR